MLKTMNPEGKEPQQEAKTTETNNEAEVRAQNILERLGLTWEDLKGKKVLDVGAGDAKIGQVGKKYAVDVVSIDRNPERWKEGGEKIPEGIDYVKASIEQLPFAEKTFDVIISHAAPPTISPTKELVKSAIADAKRVLKQGGEFRFGPVALNANIFEDTELFSEEEEKSFSRDERVKRIEEKSLEFLRSIDPQITQEKGVGVDFYRLEKF